MRTHQHSLINPAELGIFPLLAKALMFLAPQSDVSERQSAAPDRTAAGMPERRRGWLDRLDRWFWVQQQRDLEAYLSRSTDVYDLEARIHAIERNKSIPYY